MINCFDSFGVCGECSQFRTKLGTQLDHELHSRDFLALEDMICSFVGLEAPGAFVASPEVHTSHVSTCG